MSDGDSSDRLMSIGAFASRSRLSMRALRLYDQQGLLRPDCVDPDNGYRWYREHQLYTARLIALLRQLDMPLVEVAELVATPVTDAAERLDAYWKRVEQRAAAQRRLVELLRASLTGGGAEPDDFSVDARDVPEQVVIVERRHLNIVELDGWLTAAKARLRSAAEGCGGTTGRLFVVYYGEVGHESDGPVEACVPVARAPGMAGPDQRVEPARYEAFAAVTKGQFEFPQILSAYDAVERWIAAHHHSPVGPPREVYFDDVDPCDAVADELVCEVARPCAARP